MLAMACLGDEIVLSGLEVNSPSFAGWVEKVIPPVVLQRFRRPSSVTQVAGIKAILVDIGLSGIVALRRNMLYRGSTRAFDAAVREVRLVDQT
jgi:hypothetical protein